MQHDGLTSKRSWRHLRRDFCAICKPIPIGAERQTERLILHPQVAVAAPPHGIWHHVFDFLRDHADIGLLAAEIAEAIVAETVGEMAEQDNVMLQCDVRPPPTAATTT